jgi:GNAT superfamily N-acetyltransferase
VRPLAWIASWRSTLNPSIRDERVSPAILREVTKPSPDRPNRVHLFAAFEGRAMIGGAVTLLLPAFGVVFGSYIFADPALRGARRGTRILREVIRQEKQGPERPSRSPRVFRIYGEVTANSGEWWHRALERAGFRFFPALWPLGSYGDPGKVIPGRLCYCPLRRPPERFSQPAMLAYVHSLFYGPDAMHRHLLPRLEEFVELDAPGATGDEWQGTEPGSPYRVRDSRGRIRSRLAS